MRDRDSFAGHGHSSEHPTVVRPRAPSSLPYRLLRTHRTPPGRSQSGRLAAYGVAAFGEKNQFLFNDGMTEHARGIMTNEQM